MGILGRFCGIFCEDFREIFLMGILLNFGGIL